MGQGIPQAHGELIKGIGHLFISCRDTYRDNVPVELPGA